MHGLHFVQIDEFYPIDPRSTTASITTSTTSTSKAFGLDPQAPCSMNCDQIGLEQRPDARIRLARLRVDLSLRTRQPISDAGAAAESACLQRVDDWCQDYEDRIRNWAASVSSWAASARRPHRLQRRRLRSSFDHAADGHQLRDSGGRRRRTWAASKSRVTGW